MERAFDAFVSLVAGHPDVLPFLANARPQYFVPDAHRTVVISMSELEFGDVVTELLNPALIIYPNMIIDAFSHAKVYKIPTDHLTSTMEKHSCYAQTYSCDGAADDTQWAFMLYLADQSAVVRYVGFALARVKKTVVANRAHCARCKPSITVRQADDETELLISATGPPITVDDVLRYLRLCSYDTSVPRVAIADILRKAYCPNRPMQRHECVESNYRTRPIGEGA